MCILCQSKLLRCFCQNTPTAFDGASRPYIVQKCTANSIPLRLMGFNFFSKQTTSLAASACKRSFDHSGFVYLELGRFPSILCLCPNAYMFTCAKMWCHIQPNVRYTHKDFKRARICFVVVFFGPCARPTRRNLLNYKQTTLTQNTASSERTPRKRRVTSPLIRTRNANRLGICVTDDLSHIEPTLFHSAP